MTAYEDANSGTIPLSAEHRFDEVALGAWMSAHVEGFEGPLAVEKFKGGQSNPTFKLITPKRHYVLRRKPVGPVLKGAHAVEREAKVLAALGPAGFPVAHVHGLCTDESIIGSAFFVMDMVEGRIFWDASLATLPRETRSACFEAMNTTLAALHDIDYTAIGLGDYGRAGGYFERQIALWSKQYLADEDAGRDPNMDRLVEWLPANLPDAPGWRDETVISHGDFRIDNLIFHPSEPRIIAVLDWELSTLGHPLADFSYHAMMYHMPAELGAGLGGVDLEALNLPLEADYASAYAARTGRKDMIGYDYALAFNFFRFCAIVHGIKGRVIRGNASSAQAKSRAEALPALAALAWKMAERAEA